MRSLILSTTTRLLIPLLLLFSIFLLFRGHNDPGGGFVGGLTVAAAFRLYAFAYDMKMAQRALPAEPRYFIVTGLIAAVSAGILPLVLGQPFLTGLWLEPEIPVLGKLGTPFLFDVGVYLVVIGAALTIIIAMTETDTIGDET